MLAGKNILVGVTGGIAAYKSAQLVRELKKKNASVRVMMTEAAQRFVSRLSFETLSENNVAIDVFGDENTSPTAHIEWARWPDLIVVCPATANTLGKIANGIADNFITTTLLATTCPILLCPAMNVEMYKNVLFQENLQRLRSAGFAILEPGSGELACGEVGVGRLVEPEDILQEIAFLVKGSDDLKGCNVLVTAGPTVEAIDPVRFLSNCSSGKMGFAIAAEAAFRGAKVTLVSGPTHLNYPPHVEVVKVSSAEDMATAVHSRFAESDIVVMAAAVADYRPIDVQSQKIKKSDEKLSIELSPTEDILFSLGQSKKNQFLVGFALETENAVQNAIDKMERKNCDLMILNNPLERGAGFEHDTNRITIIDKNKLQQQLELMSKQAAAQKIWDAVKAGL